MKAKDCRDPAYCIERIRHWQAVADRPGIGAQQAEDHAMKWKRRLNELGGPPLHLV